MSRHDVIIVGAGPAGLSAALNLGRARRRVVVCDAGRPRNAASRHAHGYLTRDGIPPREILRIGRTEAAAYGVEFIEQEVSDATCDDAGVSVQLADGTTLAGRKLLLATGVRDHVPPLDGIAPLYGISVHHCPYCDGWENRDRPLAAYGAPDAASGLALSLLNWSRDVVVCTDGRPLTPKSRRRLREHGLAARVEPIVRLDGTDGRLERIVFADGPPLERHALFFNTGQAQRSPLADRLGCTFNDKGHVKCDRKRRTGVPNLFLAGDASGDVQFVVNAAAEGAQAAVAINAELQEEDLAAERLARTPAHPTA
jgi:thioredoxin reductase